MFYMYTLFLLINIKREVNDIVTVKELRMRQIREDLIKSFFVGLKSLFQESFIHSSPNYP